MRASWVLTDPSARLTLGELIAMHELESVRDIFVEGDADRRFYTYMLGQMGIDDVTVSEVADIELPIAEQLAGGVSRSRREQLIFLAAALQDRSQRDLTRRVACIADADSDYVYGTRRPEQLLLVTDGTALELYAFNEAVVSKFLSVVVHSSLDPAAVLASIAAPLQNVFAVRLVKEEFGVTIEAPELHPDLAERQGALHFDVNNYVSRLLNKAGMPGEREAFLRRHSELRALFPEDPVKAIGGHDFVEGLRVLLKRAHASGTGFKPEGFFGHALLGCVQPENVSSADLFRELSRRFDA